MSNEQEAEYGTVTLPCFVWQVLLSPLKELRLQTRRDGFVILSRAYHEIVQKIELAISQPDHSGALPETYETAIRGCRETVQQAKAAGCIVMFDDELIVYLADTIAQVQQERDVLKQVYAAARNWFNFGPPHMIDENDPGSIVTSEGAWEPMTKALEDAVSAADKIMHHD